MNITREVAQKLEASPLVACLVLDNPEDAVPVGEALLTGGITAIELTLRTPSALAAITTMAERFPDLLVGAGTVLTRDQVTAVKQAGAAFGVSPGLNLKVVEAARAEGFSFAPGIATPTDLEAAIEAGCRVVKFFPSEPLGGLDYLRSLAAPVAHLGIRYFPLGGINEGNLKAYLAMKDILAIGGSWIAERRLIQEKNWKEIELRATRARAFLDNKRKVDST